MGIGGVTFTREMRARAKAKRLPLVCLAIEYPTGGGFTFRGPVTVDQSAIVYQAYMALMEMRGKKPPMGERVAAGLQELLDKLRHGRPIKVTTLRRKGNEITQTRRTVKLTKRGTVKPQKRARAR